MGRCAFVRRQPTHDPLGVIDQLVVQGFVAAIASWRQAHEPAARIGGISALRDKALSHQTIDGTTHPALLETQTTPEFTQRNRTRAGELRDDLTLRWRRRAAIRCRALCPNVKPRHFPQKATACFEAVVVHSSD